MSTQKKEVIANQHDSYRQFTTIAVLLPFVGIILGIIYLTKDRLLDKKLGTHLLIVSVISSAVCSLIYILIVTSAVNSAVNTSSSTSQSKSKDSSAQVDASKYAFGKFEDTLKIGGNSGLSVTLTRVIDPVTSAYKTPDTGNRLLAVEFTIKNNTGATYTYPITNDIIITGSDKKYYTPVGMPANECTYFYYDDSGTKIWDEISLTAGSSSTGCVMFQMPSDTTISDVMYTPSGLSDYVGDWSAK